MYGCVRVYVCVRLCVWVRCFTDESVWRVQESGSLLLWEGNFIKLEIARTDGSLPHQGPINVVHLDRQSKQFVTAGVDGYVVVQTPGICVSNSHHSSLLVSGGCACRFVRWWLFESIDGADLQEDEPKFLLEPSAEVFLGDGVSVKGLVKSIDGSFWYDGGCFSIFMLPLPYP